MERDKVLNINIMNKPKNTYSLTLRDKINRFNSQWREAIKLVRVPAIQTSNTIKPNYL